jgi:hypothetical protein
MTKGIQAIRYSIFIPQADKTNWRTYDMHVDLKKSSRVVLAAVLATVFAVPQSLMAQAAAHVVSPAELQKAAVTASQTRQQNIQTVQDFLSNPKAAKAIKDARIDLQKVKNSVAQLSDEEVAQLASRAQKAKADFAAGDLSDRDLIFIILGIVALVLIIVAVR